MAGPDRGTLAAKHAHPIASPRLDDLSVVYVFDSGGRVRARCQHKHSHTPTCATGGLLWKNTKGDAVGMMVVVNGTDRVIADGEDKDHGTLVTVSAAAKDDITVEHFSPPGVDAPPMPGDFAGTFEGTASGEFIAAGYVDVKNAGTAEPGDVRIYSRDANRAPVAQIVVRGNGEILIESNPVIVLIGSDGTVSIGNGPGSFDMAADGTVSINGSNLTVLP